MVVMAAVICTEVFQPFALPTASSPWRNKSDLHDLTAGAEEGKGEEE